MDEIVPQEKTVINRIKEAFGLKVLPTTWNYILNLLQNPNSKSEKPQILFDVTKSLEYHEDDLKRNRNINYDFIFENKTLDHENQTNIFTPTTISNKDYPQQIEPSNYKKLLSFLKTYFTTKLSEKMVICMDAKFKGQPPVRCVPGGKYGCS